AAEARAQTGPAPPASKAAPPASWQADFGPAPAAPARPASKQHEKAAAPPGKTPDWMSDFED
ncbi:hypothetical protein ACLEQD_38525, partial [Corallococcus sp. 4LFB]